MTVSGGDAEQPPRPEEGVADETAGEQPAQGGKELVPVGQAQGEPPKQEDKRGLNKLRIAGYALLVVAVLAALVPILGLASDQREGDTSAQPKPAAEQTTTSSAKKSAEKSAEKPAKKPRTSSSAERTKSKSSASRTPSRSGAESAGIGPVIDPETTERAESEEARRKLVVGGVAVGLLLIVLWGRRVRSAKSKQ